MKVLNLVLVLFTLSLVGMGCNTTKTTANSNERNFGAAVKKDGAISFEKMWDMMKEGEHINVKVKGKAIEACQKKGCWMVVTGLENSNNEIFVKFKDYAFFVPKDLDGNTVIMEGEAFIEVTPIQELKHYAKDAGSSQEEIDAIIEPEVTYKFMADGVLILD